MKFTRRVRNTVVGAALFVFAQYVWPSQRTKR